MTSPPPFPGGTNGGYPPSTPGGGGITMNPDGTINYGSLPGGSSGSNRPIPTRNGQLDFWSYILPPELTGIDPATGKPPSIYLANETGSQQYASMRGVGEDRQKINIDKPYSFPKQMSASEVMDHFQKLAYQHPDQFMVVVKLLADGAFYGSDTSTGAPPKDYTSFGSSTQQALANAMVQYLQATEGGAFHQSFLDFVAMRAAQVTQANGGSLGNTGGSGSGSGGGGVIPLADPDTLKMYAQKAAQAALGRNLTSAQLDSFVSQFHSQQVADATAAKGTFVDKNDPRASAIQFVTQSNQGEFQQHQIQGYTDAFLNMFLSGQSAAPNVNVDPASVGY